MISMKHVCGGLAATAALLVPCLAMANAIFYADHLVLCDDFDDGTSGHAELLGGASIQNGQVHFAKGVNTGQKVKYAQEYLDHIGTDGMTWVHDFKKGESPDAPNAPAWMLNVNTTGGQAGARLQSDQVGLRAASPGGFHGGGMVDHAYHRIAYTIRLAENGKMEADVYLDGNPAGTSDPFDAVSVISDGYIGASYHGAEYRFSDAYIDNVMIFDTGMTHAEVAGIPTTCSGIVPEPSTMLLGCGLAAALAGLRRRRR
jgi:hypothetical protein